MYKKPKLIVFVDARNLIKGYEDTIKKNPDIKIFGYKQLLGFFKQEYEIIRGYYYDGAEHKKQRSNEKKRLFNMLRKMDYTLRLKEIDFSKRGHSQKGVDIYLTSDMISLAYENAYDTAVVCSGDGDYHALIDLVKSKGKKVFIMSYKECISETLKECADKVFFIEDFPQLQRNMNKNI